MQDKHEQLGEYGAIPGAPNGPPAPQSVSGSAPPLTKLEIHPIARLFPLMSDTEFRLLVDDICVNGLLEPLWIYEGKVIDGRHRLLACQALNIVPTTREWNGEGGNVFAFVISKNLRRRHLKERQRAMIAARLIPALDTEQNPSANLRSGKASEIAGILLSVSPRSVGLLR